MKLLKKLFFLSLIAGAIGMVVKKVTSSHEEDDWSQYEPEPEPSADAGPHDTNP